MTLASDCSNLPLDEQQNAGMGLDRGVANTTSLGDGHHSAFVSQKMLQGWDDVDRCHCHVLTGPS